MDQTQIPGKKFVSHAGGALREDKSNKLKYHLIPQEMITRLAKHYTEGGKVHGDWNRLKGDKEYAEKMKESAYRHFMQRLRGDTDEDHAMALVWNIFSYEVLIKKLEDSALEDIFNNLVNYISK